MTVCNAYTGELVVVCIATAVLCLEVCIVG